MSLSAKLQRLIANLFVVFITILPFIFSWVNDELFEFNKMITVYFFTALVTGIFLARMILEKRFLWQKTIFDWPLGLFLLSQAVSTIISLHPRTSLLGYYTRLNGGLLSTICYTLLYYVFINNTTPQSRRRFLLAMFFSGILSSLYAIGEHYGHSLSCLIIKGNFNVACWVQDVQTRVFATFGQPNWLAAYNVCLIGLGSAILLLPKSLKVPWTKFQISLVALSTYLNFIALIFTKSRSGILGFFASFALTLILYLLHLYRQKKLTRPRLTPLIFLTLGFLLFALIWGTQYTPSFQQITTSAHAQEASPAAYTPIPLNRPTHLSHIDPNISDSADIRLIVWQGALDIWRAHPFLGSGVETFAYSYYAHRPADHNWTSEWDFLYNKAHNELLNLAANSGAFGLFSYLSIFIILASCTLKAVFGSAHAQSAPYLIGISGALLALSLTNFFGFSTVTVQVLLYLFLALAAQIYAQSPLPSPAPTAPLTFAQKTALTLTIAITGFFFCQTWITWTADYYYARCKSNLSKANLDFAATLNSCNQAIKLRPREALYQIELADFYAQYAATLKKSNSDPTIITSLADLALNLSNRALELNPHNLNFYKTRFRTLTNLASIDPTKITLAQQTLETAISLSPTDPKLTYYYSTLLNALGQTETAALWLEKTLTLRPLYLDARLSAAQIALNQNNLPEALAQYHFVLDYINPNHQAARTALATLATASAIITP